MYREFHRQTPYNDTHYLALSCLSIYLAGKRNGSTKVILALPASRAALHYARVLNLDTLCVNSGQSFPNARFTRPVYPLVVRWHPGIFFCV